jgi:hypothetical protein
MHGDWSRRNWLKVAATMPMLGLSGMGEGKMSLEPEADGGTRFEPVPDTFPTQPPELTRELVTVAHFDVKRVKELVEARPSLAKASWDWGFGDWETALGAASHMGNRAIAEYLLAKGAAPTLFSAAMLGQLDVVKGMIAAQPGLERMRGPHSITLLMHAKAGKEGARAVLEFLQGLGDADGEPPAPLAEADLTALKGTYAFGIGTNQLIEVTADKGQVTWTRLGTMGRPLTHLGERVFYPCGAPSVRIRFTEEGGGMMMTVADPETVLVARRK